VVEDAAVAILQVVEAGDEAGERRGFDRDAAWGRCYKLGNFQTITVS
jgi:hypothetical protein